MLAGGLLFVILKLVWGGFGQGDLNSLSINVLEDRACTTRAADHVSESVPV